MSGVGTYFSNDELMLTVPAFRISNFEIPNAETFAAMEESERGEGNAYESLEEMYADIGVKVK